MAAAFSDGLAAETTSRGSGPWFGGTQRGESLNKEVEWRLWFSGTQGGEV